MPAELWLPLLVAPFLPLRSREALQDVRDRLDPVQVARVPPYVFRVALVLLVPAPVPVVVYRVWPRVRWPAPWVPVVVYAAVLLLELRVHLQLVQRPVLPL